MTTASKTENNDKSNARTPPTETSQQGQQESSGLTRNQNSQNRSGALARSLGTFGPFSLMRRLFDDLGRFTAFGMPGTRPGEGNGFDGLMFVPLVEVMHRDGKLIVNVDLPGMAVDDIQVRIDDGALIIEGERRSEHEQQDGDVWRCERSYGRFQRVIPLPEGADPETIEARFENGVLEISLPAPEPARPGRKVDIKTSGAPSDKTKQAGSH
jgi:HSP20 family protein